VRLAYLLQPPGWSPDGSTLTAAQMQAAAAQTAAPQAAWTPELRAA
jgi:hypothetical protein